MPYVPARTNVFHEIRFVLSTDQPPFPMSSPSSGTFFRALLCSIGSHLSYGFPKRSGPHYCSLANAFDLLPLPPLFFALTLLNGFTSFQLLSFCFILVPFRQLLCLLVLLICALSEAGEYMLYNTCIFSYHGRALVVEQEYSGKSCKPIGHNLMFSIPIMWALTFATCRVSGNIFHYRVP